MPGLIPLGTVARSLKRRPGTVVPLSFGGYGTQFGTLEGSFAADAGGKLAADGDGATIGRRTSTSTR